jgi:hypothetical protein
MTLTLYLLARDFHSCWALRDPQSRFRMGYQLGSLSDGLLGREDNRAAFHFAGQPCARQQS